MERFVWTGADDVRRFPINVPQTIITCSGVCLCEQVQITYTHPIHVPLYSITCSGARLCERVQMTYTHFLCMYPYTILPVVEPVCVNRCRWRTHDLTAWSVSVSSARATRLLTKGRTWRRSEKLSVLGGEGEGVGWGVWPLVGWSSCQMYSASLYGVTSVDVHIG